MKLTVLVSDINKVTINNYDYYRLNCKTLDGLIIRCIYGEALSKDSILDITTTTKPIGEFIVDYKQNTTYNKDNFKTKHEVDLKECLDKLNYIKQAISNLSEPYKLITSELLSRYGLFNDDIQNSYIAKPYNNNVFDCSFGYILYSATVLEISLNLADMLNIKEIDRNLLIAGALLHDIGNLHFSVTDLSNYLTPASYGVSLLMTSPYLSTNLFEITLLQEIISGHLLNKIREGSVSVPKTIESFIIAHAVIFSKQRVQLRRGIDSGRDEFSIGGYTFNHPNRFRK